MAISIIICGIVCCMMICGILFFPEIKIGKIKLDSYWVITLIGATILVLTQGNMGSVAKSLVTDSAINPIKILVLFISMTVLSIFLDELGFFSYLANVTLKKAKASQKKLFLYLYLTVLVLTVFTSNDIIILSFTPFICYFAKNAKISPIPYLAAEFVAANTWSMALVIGNPTNIYLATAYGIDFINYAKVMIVPTLFSGIAAFIMLYIMFRKKLSEEIHGKPEDVKIKDKLLLIIGILHLGLCTLALAVCSYIHVDMWIISMSSAISLFVITLIVSLVRKRKPNELLSCVKRAPWQLIPFIISMFSMIIVLADKGVTEKICGILGEGGIIFKYGFASFFSANIINNIPMSVLFCSITDFLPNTLTTKAVFASVVGSNLGALFTPIGALAGIMWSSILKQHGQKYGYLDFLKTGVVVALPTLFVCLFVLCVIL